MSSAGTSCGSSAECLIVRPLALDARGRRRADGEALARLPEALERDVTERFGLDDLLHLRQDPPADDDLARGRGVAEARGERSEERRVGREGRSRWPPY